MNAWTFANGVLLGLNGAYSYRMIKQGRYNKYWLFFDMLLVALFVVSITR